jgi:hypothetical protein
MLLLSSFLVIFQISWIWIAPISMNNMLVSKHSSTKGERIEKNTPIHPIAS